MIVNEVNEKLVVKLSATDLFVFSVYHNLSKLNGQLSSAMGLAGLIFAPVMFLTDDPFSGFLLAFLGIAFIIQPLVSFYFRSKRQIRTNPNFKNDMVYEIKKTGVDIKQTTLHHTLEWSEIKEIRENHFSFLIYVNEIQAFVVPKRCFADQEAAENFKLALLDYKDQVSLKFKKEKQ